MSDFQGAQVGRRPSMSDKCRLGKCAVGHSLLARLDGVEAAIGGGVPSFYFFWQAVV